MVMSSLVQLRYGDAMVFWYSVVPQAVRSVAARSAMQLRMVCLFMWVDVFILNQVPQYVTKGAALAGGALA